MAILTSPFYVSGAFPIDNRLVFSSVNAMIAFGEKSLTSRDLPKAYFAVVEDKPGKFYVYNANTTTSGGWTEVNGGEGGSSCLTSAITTTTAWGGIPKGTTLTAGTNFENIFSSALAPYIAPSNASLSISPTNGTKAPYYEKGINVEFGKFTLGATNGSMPLTAFTFSGQPSNKSGTFSQTLSSTTTFGGTVSDGKTTLDAVAEVKFVYRYYMGYNSDTSFTEELVKANAKNSVLSNETNITWNECDVKKQYIYFAYDKNYSNLREIIDDTKMNGIENWNLTAVGDYKVYYTKEPKEYKGSLTFNSSIG